MNGGEDKLPVSFKAPKSLSSLCRRKRENEGRRIEENGERKVKEERQRG